MNIIKEYCEKCEKVGDHMINQKRLTYRCNTCSNFVVIE